MHRLAWRSRFSKDRFQSLFRLPRCRTRKKLVANGIVGTVIRPIGGTRRLSRTTRESEHGRVWVSGHEFNERIGTCCKSSSHYQFDLSFEEKMRKNKHRGRAGKSAWEGILLHSHIRLIQLCIARAGCLTHVRSRSSLLRLTR